MQFKTKFKTKNKEKENNKKKKIKTIIFDLGGVVVFYDHMIAARKISELTNISKNKIFKIISGENTKFTNACEKGKPDNVYWKIMFKSLNKKPNKVPVQKLNKIFCEIFWLNKGIIPLIKKLKKEYNIALISNIGKVHEKYLSEKYTLKKLFSIRTYSYIEKSRKPSRKIFQTTLKKLNLRPSQVLFIDDKKQNINGAKKLGINSILFKNNKQLFKQLKKLEII